MKKIFVLLFAGLLLITMSACGGKKIDRSQFDEGEKMDAEESAQYAADNIGNPYAQSEIGIQRAYRNLAVVYGNYDGELQSFVRFEYVKDAVYEGAPVYVFSKKASKTQDGEYKHHSYVVMYKDGSMMIPNAKIS